MRNLMTEMISRSHACQAHKPPTINTRFQQRETILARVTGEHVGLDVFAMPPVRSEGIMYDRFALAVDTLSGYVMIFPMQQLGLTGSKLAKRMVAQWVDVFGVLSLITSEKRSIFVGAWWKTICSLLGIGQAFSHAYYHQGNGKVERAGRDIKDWLGRATIGGRESWYEVLPMVRRMYHDTPGVTGCSPQRIVFNCERHLAGVP